MLLNYLELGKIVGTHGVRGELRMDPWCDSADYVSNFSTVYLSADGGKPCHVVRARPHKNVVLLTLEGVGTVEEAEALRGTVLYVDRNEAPLPEGKAFVAELLGCTVKDADAPEREYGVIAEIYNRGASDIWVIQKDGNEYLMPAVPDLIVSSDVEAGVVLVRPIPGIFDNQAEEV